MKTLRVERVRGPVLVQDLGRRGWMHHGIAPGGALVPPLLRASNRAVGNLEGEAGLELFAPIEIRAEQALTVALDGVPSVLEAGALLRVQPAKHQRVSYLSVAGGLSVPEVLGGRGTLLSARLGGLEGRPLRAGDALSVGDTHAIDGKIHTVLCALERSVFALRRGPEPELFEPDALEVLCSNEYRISHRSDRVGVRLEGPRLPRKTQDLALSMPMVRGAMQVTAAGEAVVLGPEHPTTGGYAVLAVLDEEEGAGFFALVPGAPVRFSVVP